MYYIESKKIINLHSEMSEFLPNLNFTIPNLDFDGVFIHSIEDLKALNYPMISTSKEIHIFYSSRVSGFECKFIMKIGSFIIKERASGDSFLNSKCFFVDSIQIKNSIIQRELEGYYQIYLSKFNHN